MLPFDNELNLDDFSEYNVVIVQHRDGMFIKDIPLRYGEKHGIEKTYLNDGQLMMETTYRNDMKMGIQKIYHYGQLRYEIPYVNDMKHGIEKQYDLDGNLVQYLYIYGLLMLKIESNL